jgi:DNA-binding transcriptional LysR family regulator
MDAPRLDGWSLHCLCVFVREQSVTRAGAVLGLSQPAASAVLAKLRMTFGDQLLVKSNSRMVPTPRAMELLQQSERLLQEMRLMLEPETNVDPARFAGSVTIAAIDMARALLFPGLLEHLSTEAPGVTVRVHEVDRTRIHEQLENGSVDLGIGPSRVPTGSLHYRQLWVDSPILIAAPSTLEAAATNAQALCSFRAAVVMTSRPSFYDDELDKTLAVLGLRRNVAVIEKSYLMLPLLLERGGLVAIVPGQFGRYAVQRHALAMRDCPIELADLKVGLFWHERTHRDPMFRWIRDRIARCLPGALDVP